MRDARGHTANARHLWLCGLSGPRLRARDRGVSLSFPPLSLGSHLANGSRTNLNSANRNPRLTSPDKPFKFPHRNSGGPANV